MIDRARLKQVFINLLNNGTKYNHENGTLTIYISAGDKYITVKIADTSEGIPRQALPTSSRNCTALNAPVIVA